MCRAGAWIILVIVPTLVFVFFRIHQHYQELARSLSLDHYGAPPAIRRHRVIVPISGVHRGTLAALDYARSLSAAVTAVHISIDEVESERLKAKWERWGDGVRLVVLDSPYRMLLELLLGYVEHMAAVRQPNEIITLVVPQFVPKQAWTNLLHTQTAVLLRVALLFRKGIVVTDVPYQME